ncbi:MAG: hypothetical protein IPJ38_13505 [Dechloromonas sp.]|uniref:Uncharacterized protein n=1 Tax=Candidatus Dechloromonas phosphorivorans TaxID=2899244 RepID=A0A935JZ81_9RHOO|nr:hypothetical protein [Candidatus Dechloromonas phosphorivorans]
MTIYARKSTRHSPKPLSVSDAQQPFPYALRPPAPTPSASSPRCPASSPATAGWILESSFHLSDVLTSRYPMRIEIKADSSPFLLASPRERFRKEVGEPLQNGLADQR